MSASEIPNDVDINVEIGQADVSGGVYCATDRGKGVSGWVNPRLRLVSWTS